MNEFLENNFLELFSKAIPILKKLEDNNFKAYFVGGCVRDYLMNRKFNDIDITTSATPEEMKKIFYHTIDTGIKHGTITVEHNNNYYEITTFRSESNYINHRKPEKVKYIKNLKEDLNRRDFTINAIALTHSNNIIDFHNGINDINNKIIRTVNEPNERFSEDALRMLRAFRFASQLNFNIEKNTLDAIKYNAHLIKFISIERIIAEFRKFFKGKSNKDNFKILLESTINEYIPFFKYIKNDKIIDFSKYNFNQILYYLSFINNIDFEEIKKLKLSNNENKKIKIYKNIKNNFQNLTINELLYRYELEDILFINSLFNYEKKEKILKTNIIIKNFKDIDISVKEIIQLFPEKNKGAWIKKIISNIETAILNGNLINKKTNILEFIKREVNKYDY